MSGNGDILKAYLAEAIEQLQNAGKLISAATKSDAPVSGSIWGQPMDFTKTLKIIEGCVHAFRNAQRLIGYRTTGWNLLINVCNGEGVYPREGIGDALKTQIEEEQSGAEFDHLRHLACQAYVNAVWSLADVITGAAGKIILSNEKSQAGSAAKLNRNFLGSRNGKAQHLLFKPVRSTAISEIRLLYVIRNHFVHDGLQRQEKLEPFFRDNSPSNGMAVNFEAWKRICNDAGLGQDSKLLPRDSVRSDLDGESFFDLRKVFEEIVPRMDQVLGILACYAAKSALTMVELIIELPPSASSGENDAL